MRKILAGFLFSFLNGGRALVATILPAWMNASRHLLDPRELRKKKILYICLQKKGNVSLWNLLGKC